MTIESPNELSSEPGYHDVQWTSDRVARLWNYYGNSPAHASAYFSMIFGADILRGATAFDVALDGKRVVDFGCGPGHLLEHLLKQYRPQAAWGVEFSRQSAHRATERVRHFGPFQGVVAAEQLPVDLPDACCDVLLLIEVVEHLDDQILDGTLAEAKRLVRPGGHVVVTTPNAENLDLSKTACPDCGCVFHYWQHVRSWTAESLRARVEAAGWLTEASTPVSWHAGATQSPMEKLRRIRESIRRRIRGPRGPHLIYVGRRP